MPIRKAVIPAAGFGTRFLPASKSQPKEMLPIVDTPTIQYVVEEAVSSGITDILMVIGRGKRSIEEHFDRHLELELELEQKGKLEELECVRHISSLAEIHFIWQKTLNGLGDAVQCARHHVGSEPFAVLLGDTIVDSPRPVTQQLMEVYERYSAPVVALEQVERTRVDRYGIVGGTEMQPDLYRVSEFVEKPSVDEAPSTLAIAGRYVFTAEIFDWIARTPRGKNGEIQLTDAMRLMLQQRAMYALRFDGVRYDIGNKLDFIKTNVAFGLKRPDIAGGLREYLRSVVAHEGREG